MRSKENEYRTLYSSMTSDDLLHALAFQWEDYTNEAQVALTSVAEERGVSERDVWDYRAKTYAGSEVLTHCTKCGEELRLNSTDLSTGSFECPECSAIQRVAFSSLRVKSKSRLSDSVPVEKTDSIQVAPKGIGGWLILVKVGLSIGVLLAVFALWSSVSDGILIDSLLNLVDLGIFILLLYMFATEKRLFPTFFIVFLSLGALISLAVANSPEAPQGSIRDAVVSILQAAVWIPYMMVSKRVKATFVNKLRTRQTSEIGRDDVR